MEETEGTVCQHFQRAAEVLGRRWNPQIVRVLLGGPRRFGQIREGVPGISDHLLSERLKQLEAEGIVHREVTGDRPVLIEYTLTAAGSDLQDAIGALASWAERWATTPPQPSGGTSSRSEAGARSR
jgi:DNA-binding HxlR family transcriptional regulator